MSILLLFNFLYSFGILQYVRVQQLVIVLYFFNVAFYFCPYVIDGLVNRLLCLFDEVFGPLRQKHKRVDNFSKLALLLLYISHCYLELMDDKINVTVAAFLARTFVTAFKFLILLYKLRLWVIGDAKVTIKDALLYIRRRQ